MTRWRISCSFSVAKCIKRSCSGTASGSPWSPFVANRCAWASMPRPTSTSVATSWYRCPTSPPGTAGTGGGPMTRRTWIRQGWLLPRKERRMSKLNDLKSRLLADESIDDAEVELLRRELYADGAIDREEAVFLVELRGEAKSTCAAFEQFFFAALKQHLLDDGTIDAE